MADDQNMASANAGSFSLNAGANGGSLNRSAQRLLEDL